MRPDKYKTHIEPFLHKVEAWAKQGASQKEIAANLGVAESTYCKYLALGRDGVEPYTEFSECFYRACEIPDDMVEAAMYKRACGIEYDERTFERKWDPAREAFVEVCIKRVTRYIPPDITACMFWLANRRPDRWKYKPDAAAEAEEGTSGVVELPAVMAASPPPGVQHG